MPIDAEMKVGMLPNFIKLDLGLPPGKSEDGWDPNSRISVGQLSPEQAEEYADKWKVEFLEHCRVKREQFDRDFT